MIKKEEMDFILKFTIENKCEIGEERQTTTVKFEKQWLEDFYKFQPGINPFDMVVSKLIEQLYESLPWNNVTYDRFRIFQLNDIFVFGSNTEGRHGMGSALYAKIHHGAVYGQSRGMQGSSYAICTKDISDKRNYKSLPKEEIIDQIKELYKFSKNRPWTNFIIPYNAHGTNLNFYSPLEMAEMFACEIPPNNIVFEEQFYKLVRSCTTK